MLSQVITVIKDTSFLAQVAIQEFFNNSKWIMSAQADSSVDQTLRVFVIFGFVALVYFIINFVLSYIVRSQKRTVWKSGTDPAPDGHLLFSFKSC